MKMGQWIRARLGKLVDYDHVYGAQCVDLVNDYLATVRQLPPMRGNAIDLRGQRLPTATWVDNGPLNYPAAGSIACWTFGQYGHVAVVLWADSYALVTVDANWAGNQRVQVVAHDYTQVAGWQSFS